MSDRSHGSELKHDFGMDFAGSAFRQIDGETRIVGKYGQIVQMADSSYDAWFVGPNLSPLTGKRLGVITRSFQDGRFKALDGEGWIRGTGREFVLRSASLAGVKRRRIDSESKRSANIARLAASRAARAAT